MINGDVLDNVGLEHDTNFIEQGDFTNLGCSGVKFFHISLYSIKVWIFKKDNYKYYKFNYYKLQLM